MILQAYDGHMNLILSDVEETIMLVDGNEAVPPAGRINVRIFTSLSYRANNLQTHRLVRRIVPLLFRWRNVRWICYSCVETV